MALSLVVGGCGSGRPGPVPSTGAAAQPTSAASTPSPTAGTTVDARIPRFDHVVVVVLENHGYGQIIGSSDAPFLNRLAAAGAVLTSSFAITHPSEPNYLALFSGSTQGLTDDSCPHAYPGPNLGSALLAAGDTFVGYSEDLPGAGSTSCASGGYARKHNPWADFPALPAAVNQPLTAFPADPSSLPSVSFVVPNLAHDMHDGSVAAGDAWVRAHLGPYAAWAAAHSSLLIVTADEDDSLGNNRIATIVTGAHVRAGPDDERVDHYGLLATLLASFGLPAFGKAVAAHPITAIWTP